MMFPNLKHFPCALLLGAAAAMPAASAQTTPGTTISLNYGGQGACKFITTSGVSINGATGQIAASGQFDANSSCPTGGETGAASVNLAASATTVDANTPITLNWTAVGDVCRYDGSVLPAALTGWPTSGDACIGSSACGSAHSVSLTPTVGGSYNFKLTCTSGASGTQPQTSANKTVAVTVNGAPPPQTEQCVAPTSLTRIGNRTINKGSGTLAKTTSYRHWETTIGFVLATLKYYSWPGVRSNDSKYYIGKNEYAAMKFTVPNNYPYGWNSYPTGPYGAFNMSNTTDITSGVTWALSITEDCGDFMRPASTDPRYACFTEMTAGTGNRLYWAVRPTTASSGVCNLQRGKTYYLNIVAGRLNAPAQNTCTSSGTCKVNIANTIFNDDAGSTYHELLPTEIPTD